MKATFVLANGTEITVYTDTQIVIVSRLNGRVVFTCTVEQLHTELTKQKAEAKQ